MGVSLSQKLLMFTFLFSLLLMSFGRKANKIRNVIFYILVLIPIINFSKGGFFFYNVMTVILLSVNLWIMFSRPGYFRSLLTNGKGILFWLLIFVVLYYFASFFNTLMYNSNLRIFELLLTAFLVPILWKDRTIFKMFVFVMSIQSILFVLFISQMAGADARLMLDASMLLEEGVEIGGNNPISYGLPVVFSILTIFIYLRNETFVKKTVLTFILVILVLCLFITTSRGSFLILIVTLALFFIKTGRIRSLINASFVFILCFVLIDFLASVNDDFGFAYDFLVNRTQSEESINKISHGRMEQWEAMYEYSKSSGINVLFGFGPGMQYDAHEIISMSLISNSNAYFQGSRIAYHALPLLLISEIGLLGVLLFYSIMLAIYRSANFFFKRTGSFLPIAGFIGWFTAGLSVSSFDSFSGLFLGLAFIPLIDIEANNILRSE